MIGIRAFFVVFCFVIVAIVTRLGFILYQIKTCKNPTYNVNDIKKKKKKEAPFYLIFCSATMPNIMNFFCFASFLCVEGLSDT